MIEYINKRMNEWANWCKRRDDGGLGYPSESHYCKALQIRGPAAAGAITRFASEEEVEAVMVRIRKESPPQWEVAEWFYLKGSFTKSRIAKELRCSEVSVYNRLHALHVSVMNGLQDLEIEAQDRVEATRATRAVQAIANNAAINAKAARSTARQEVAVA